MDMTGDARFPGYGVKGGNAHPFSLLFFHPEFQRIYRGWWKTILETPNPHTGVPLGKDPAVACLEIVNEDSNLFWTFAAKNIPAEEMVIIERQFADWLKAKYGSADAALAKW